MPYRLQVPEAEVFGPGKYANTAGRTECVVFVQQAARAPVTTLWRQGVRVIDAAPGSIARGTAIATFDEAGRYPTDGRGRHAAIYLWHDKQGIRVLDQWNTQGEVKERSIRVRDTNDQRVNDADFYWVIE